MKKSSLCVSVSKNKHTEMHHGSVEPIDPSTAFDYIDSGAQPYPRYFNTPNQNVLSQKIADLEEAESALVFGSGMAAISTTLLAQLNPGDHAVFLDGLYGGTQTFIAHELEDRGVQCSFVQNDPASFQAAIRENTKVIYVESPTNPMMDIVDLFSIVDIAKKRQNNGRSLTTIIDNTFASPINQNPIAIGFDIVVHSGTKYLGGHSDLCCGAVATSRQLIGPITRKAKHYGGSINGITGYLLDRSLKTLDVRVTRQNESALAMAHWLEQCPNIERVWYPGLTSHAGHEIAKKQMSGFGGMMAIELKPHVATTEFLRNLKVVRAALSLGGVESSVCIPATTSHRDVPVEKLNSLGVNERVVRFSVGIESVNDLQQDIDQAIQSASAAAPTGVTV